MSGWVEYQAAVRETGWYQLISHGAPPGGVEFEIDPDIAVPIPHKGYFYQRLYPIGQSSLVGNVWLTAGTHRVRLTRYFWTGFPKIKAIELRRSSGGLSDSIRIHFPSDQRTFRVGECPQLIVSAGGDSARGSLEIVDSNIDGSREFGKYRVEVALLGTPATWRLAIGCQVAGFHKLGFRVNGLAAAMDARPSLDFQIVDTHSAPPHPVRTADKKPLVEIDCAKQAPDYASEEGTRLRTTSELSYRESGDTGWIDFQRTNPAGRISRPEPDWFAYTVRGVLPEQRYRVDIDYPDDTFRSFAVAWRDTATRIYPAAVAVETGREYQLSHKVRTMTFHVWALASGPRLVLMSPHDGDRAACLRIRVTLADPPSAPAKVARPGYRQFINWYEEGEDFTAFFGTRDDGMESMSTATRRWFAEAAELGVSSLVPTVVIYNFAMYPSRYNRAFSEPERDILRILVVEAERLGLGIVPELHPRADELAYSRADRRTLENLAVSRDGKNNFAGDSGRNVPPHFNALDPGNQEWYVGMIRELAERYRDSPAFHGVSLRYMTWANPALNNLVDLDWGYDDYSVSLYRTETGSRVPLGNSNDPQRFRLRHAWLLSNEKEAWTRWRCDKITALFTRIRNTLRLVRPDLQIYLHLFGPPLASSPGRTPPAGEVFLAKLREAGLDLEALGQVDGVVVMNSSFNYGRGEQHGLVDSGARDPLLTPGLMGAFPLGPRKQWYVPTSRYIEATSDIVPPQMLGFPASTRTTWMSAASNPPGRLALERYAILLAETDALAMGDGGNNQTLGPPEVAEFAKEFRKLPLLPFEQVRGAEDPVMVRALRGSKTYIFYAVNRESFPVDVAFALSGNGNLKHGVESLSVGPGIRKLELRLQPYELRVVEADPTIQISSVDTVAPESDRERIGARIKWVDNLLAGKAGPRPAESNARTLREASAAAREAFQRGWLWRAHTALEVSPVLQAFRRAGCTPPDLLGSVQNPDGCSALVDK